MALNATLIRYENIVSFCGGKFIILMGIDTA